MLTAGKRRRSARINADNDPKVDEVNRDSFCNLNILPIMAILKRTHTTMNAWKWRGGWTVNNGVIPLMRCCPSKCGRNKSTFPGLARHIETTK